MIQFVASLILLCLGVGVRAELLELREVRGQGPSEAAALVAAMEDALKRAATRLNIEANAEQLAMMVEDYQSYLTRRNPRITQEGGTTIVVVDCLVDREAVERLLARKLVAKASDVLGRPQLAVAILARRLGGRPLDAETRAFYLDKLNTTLKEELYDVGIDVVSPPWLQDALGSFEWGPRELVALQGHLLGLAKKDPSVHYLVAGTATFDIEELPRSAGASASDYRVYVNLSAGILSTFTESNLEIPFQCEATFEGGRAGVLAGQAGMLTTQRGAREAIRRLVEDWNRQVTEGTIYTLHVVARSPAFVDQLQDALDIAGRVLDRNQEGDILWRFRYLTAKVRRVDFGSASGLRRHFREGTSIEPFGCLASPPMWVLYEATGECREGATNVVNGQRYTLLSSPKPAETATVADADTRLAFAARQYGEAVGLVVWHSERVQVATAWAFAPKRFASNGHVTHPVAEALADGKPAYIYLNRKGGTRLKITGAKTHPRYNPAAKDPHDQIAYDVGILEVEQEAPVHFSLADESMLGRLMAGQRLAYLGFPVESLLGNNVNLSHPIASMQSGIVVAVSDFRYGDSGFAGNRLLRHNLPATGGASGSPMFDPEGRVVAILNAGNIAELHTQSPDGKTTTGRTPSAAQINFAQRVDLLHDIP